MSRQPLVLAQELLYRYLGRGAVTAITPKEKELSAVGISVAAGCEPRSSYYLCMRKTFTEIMEDYALVCLDEREV